MAKAQYRDLGLSFERDGVSVMQSHTAYTTRMCAYSTRMLNRPKSQVSREHQLESLLRYSVQRDHELGWATSSHR